MWKAVQRMPEEDDTKGGTVFFKPAQPDKPQSRWARWKCRVIGLIKEWILHLLEFPTWIILGHGRLKHTKGSDYPNTICWANGWVRNKIVSLPALNPILNYQITLHVLSIPTALQCVVKKTQKNYTHICTHKHTQTLCYTEEKQRERTTLLFPLKPLENTGAI